MDGLDLLKQHWNEDRNFPKIEREEIRRMTHKSSSSIVKWIFIISLIELTIGIILGLFVLPDNNSHPLFYKIAYTSYDIIFYAVILYFIYRFFTSYWHIKNTTNTKVLLETILETRKHVNRYIQFNIYCIIFAFILTSVEMLVAELKGQSIKDVIPFVLFMIFLVSIFCWLFLLLVRVYYKLLYKRLVKKLDNNYEELIRIEEGPRN
ncbi:hypothetical protein [Sphingobacterium sp. LRF_L2]|uniref:hypothetical protein n=1 Tax=Sphingobacterium sp. LRF_L2 TaxID=3369421 RepID=UPI003F5F8DBF